MKKKLVDLIYLDNKRLEYDLKTDYWTRINFWLEWINITSEKQLTQDILIEEQSEYLVLKHFLKNFLARRLEWIFDSVGDLELRNKYLLALPPFYRQGNIKSYLLHFFQLENCPKDRKLKFVLLNKSEREIRILWDVYKLVNTLKTIDVIMRSSSETNTYSSAFSEEYIATLLNTLTDALNLLIKICVKPEYHHEVLTEFPRDCFDPESILNRRLTNQYLINDIVLEKFDYRNYFFHIFFRSGMKATYNEKTLVFSYNYLDFEIIKQEFLIHWLNDRLADNPKKNEVFDRYTIGGKTFSEIVEKDPEAELTVLKQLPKDVFDDLIADVNQEVEEECKVLVDPMSERIGEFARQFTRFEKAKELTQKPIHAIRHYLDRIRGKSDQKEKIDTNEKAVENTMSEEVDYQISILSINEIDYPYFCAENFKFSRNLIMLRSKLQSNEYEILTRTTEGLFSTMSEKDLIKRRTPRHEWVVPFLVREKSGKSVFLQLLILGVEAKNQQLSMGYGLGMKEIHKLKPYFVYGSKEKQLRMGNPIETRLVKGERFHVYPFYNPNVLKKVFELVDAIGSK